MNRELSRAKVNESRKRKVRRTKLYLAAILSFSIIILGFIYNSIFSDANDNRTNEPQEFKYYRTIEASGGDSLWSIAEENRYDDNMNTKEYVEELMFLNDMDSSKIIAGQKVTVIYIDGDYKL